MQIGEAHFRCNKNYLADTLYVSIYIFWLFRASNVLLSIILLSVCIPLPQYKSRYPNSFSTRKPLKINQCSNPKVTEESVRHLDVGFVEPHITLFHEQNTGYDDFDRKPTTETQGLSTHRWITINRKLRDCPMCD